LICEKCTRKLDNAFELRRLAKHADNNYFQLLKNDQYSKVELVECNEEAVKASSNVCHKPISLIKCWRCSLKNIINILPKKTQNQAKDIDSSKDLPEAVLSALASQGCVNSLEETDSVTKLELKIPIVMLDRIQLPQIKQETNVCQESNISEEDKPPVKTFTCRICKKKLTHHVSLRYHIAAIHLNIKRYFCDLCDGKFFYKERLIAHIKNHIKNPQYKIEKEMNKFQCPRCVKSFVSIQRLKRHSILHSGKIYFRNI
jgi:hypothetical protein